MSSELPDLHRPGAVVWKHTFRPPFKEAITRLRYDNKVFIRRKFSSTFQEVEDKGQVLVVGLS